MVSFQTTRFRRHLSRSLSVRTEKNETQHLTPKVANPPVRRETKPFTDIFLNCIPFSTALTCECRLVIDTCKTSFVTSVLGSSSHRR